MKKIVFLITLFAFIIGFGNVSKAQENEQNNPYVKAYLEEKKNVRSIEMEDEEVVDPQVENKIIIDTLNDYYSEDLMLLDMLKEYSIDNSLEKEILSTDREDKKSAMHKIITLYDQMTDFDHKNMAIDFVERYFRYDDGVDEKAQEFLNEINKDDKVEIPEEENVDEEKLKASDSNDTTSVEMQTRAVSMNNAGTWAYNNYNKYSRNYPKFTGDFGTDCTNFVSQALHVGGGLPFQGNWKISKLNDKYWVINSSSQLNASWKVTNPSPWISVKEFSKYWLKNAVRTYSYSHDKYIKNHGTIYGNKIYKGSVVIFTKGVAGFAGVPTHAMIVSSYDGGKKDFLLAGHSVERQKYPLMSAIKKYSMIDILVIKN